MTTSMPLPTPAAPVRRASAWDRFLFDPESPSPMVLVRAAWGIAAAIWAITLLPDIDPFLTKGALRSTQARQPGSWNPLDWIGWTKAPLVVCVVLLVAAVATAVGYRSRLSSAVAVLSMLALQRTNITIFNSGDLVLRQIGIAVALAPTGLLLSLDARRARRLRPPEVGPSEDIDGEPDADGVATPRRAPWATRLLQLQLALGYSLSCWAKVRGSTWHDGTALALALRISDLHRFNPPASIFHEAALLNLLTWATLVFEGSFIFLVWNRRFRPWVLCIGVLFHLGIDLFFDVGFFSWAMWIAYLAFLPPEVADQVIDRIRGVFRRLTRTEATARAAASTAAVTSAPTVLLPVEPPE